MANEPIIGEDKTVKNIEEKMDPTEARKKRCEPIILAVLQQMLDKEILYSDVAYIEQMVLQYMEALFKKISYDHQQTIFQGLVMSLQKSLKDASDILWEKDGENITLKDIDKILQEDKKEIE